MALTKYSSFNYSGFDDIIGIGSDRNDLQLSGSGNDRIDGHGGDDTIKGFYGDDNISGSDGNDYIDGYADNDTLSGGSGSDTLYGGTGFDTLYGGSGFDILVGGDDNDYLSGDADNDILYGDNGNDTLYGGYNDDTLYGGFGNDSLYGGDGNDVAAGREGNDTLYGERGNDYLIGDEDDDYLFGGDDNDTLSGGTGTDYIDGHIGYDAAIYTGAYNQYYASFTRTGAIRMVGLEGTDYLYGVERISFRDDGSFYNVYTGDAGSNSLIADAGIWSLLYGGDNDDRLTGGNYNDTLTGGNGNDTMLGGTGFDIATYFGQYSEYGVTFAQDGAVQITGGEGTDLIYDTERIYFSDAGAYVSVYVGDAGANNLIANPNDWSILFGSAGNDVIVGSNLMDRLDGGFSDDTLTGGAGDDYLNGYGSIVTNDSQYDRLTGGGGYDKFVLGETGKVFYNETGDGYGVIQDWDPNAGDMDTFDRVQLAGNASQYKLEFISVGGIGSSAKDTNILFKVGTSWERIGIIQDSTDFSLNRDAVFV